MFTSTVWRKFKSFDKQQCMLFLNFLNDTCINFNQITFDCGNRYSMKYFRRMYLAFSFMSCKAGIKMSMDVLLISCSIFNWQFQLPLNMIPHVSMIMNNCVMYNFLDSILPVSVRSLVFSFVFEQKATKCSINAIELNRQIVSMPRLDSLLLLQYNYTYTHIVDDIMEKYYECYNVRMGKEECKRIESIIDKNGNVNILDLVYKYHEVQYGIKSLRCSLNSFGFDN
jgi:hypothetical protein